MADPVEIRNSMLGWHFESSEIADATLGWRMLNVSLDLSNPCNLNCPYCYIEEKNSSRKVRLAGELTIDETLSVIAQFAKSNAKTVNLVGAGEPTIDPAFRSVVAAIADFGMTPVVFTNGSRLSEERDLVDFLYRRGATVVLKYNAIDGRKQDLLAGKVGYADRRNAALRWLLDTGFNEATPTRLAFDIIAVRGNMIEIPQVHRFCRQQGILPILGDLIPTGRTENGQFVGHASIARLPESSQQEIAQLLEPLRAAERIALYAQLKEIDEKEFDIFHQDAPAYYSGFSCTQLLGLYVDIRGNIWPCVARAQRTGNVWRSEPLGNVRHGDDLVGLWRNSPYMRDLRAGFDGCCPYKPKLGSDIVSISRSFRATPSEAVTSLP
jgi:MoaA/NifB/PqqE/SkfB family radical SAM enzyme